MRHSSWTLFLVPLALALVFLCLPGSMKSVGRTAPVVGQVHGGNPDGPLASEDARAMMLDSGKAGSRATSEDLFKD